MSSLDLSDPKVVEALDRAGMRSLDPQTQEELHAAWDVAGGGEGALLEISRAVWGNETEGGDVLVVLLREHLVLVAPGRKGLFGGSRPSARPLALADYNDLGKDDELLGHSVIFLAPDADDHFLLSWRDPRERDRMFKAMFLAHRKDFGSWGIRLDPAEYGADFDRFHAQLVAEAPSAGGTIEVMTWAGEQFGEYDLANALGCAVDWREAEIADAAGREPSQRVGRLTHPHPWIDMGPEAERLFQRLGEQLFDAGLLGPPYDERTFGLGDEPLSNVDAGPARLLALMNLALLARRFDHPRAQQWIDQATGGIPLVPPSVFSKKLRERWSAIGRLPEVDEGPPPEIPIQEDVDVLAISIREGDRVTYDQSALSEADRESIRVFFEADGKLSAEGPPSGEAILAVCLLGVRAFEGLSSGAPDGWRKLLLYAVSDLTYDLWNRHKVADPAARLAHWVVATIEANDWGPDGRSTPLGQHHSFAMGVAVGTGVGAILIDPETGHASAPTGDEARRAAAAGGF